MAVTLQQIAERAGVSQATVSIALGSSGRIGDKTRRKVLLIAEELGYRPNLLVHAIQTGKTFTIGVLMRTHDNYCGLLLQGIQEGISKKRFVPIVLGPVKDASEIEQIHALIDRRVDGILLRPTGFAQWEQHLDEALLRDVPVVAMDIEPQSDSPHIDFVGSDDIRGSEIAAERFLEAGHRCLGVVTTGQFPDRMVFRQRTFESRIAENGEASCVSVSEPWMDDIDGYDAAINLLKMTPRPTAIFVTMDQLAVGVYRAASDLGLSIPEDLSVIGFDDAPVARYLNPKLTTIRQTPFEIGKAATALLLKNIETPRTDKKRSRILIDCDLVERESVASPKGDV